MVDAKPEPEGYSTKSKNRPTLVDTSCGPKIIKKQQNNQPSQLWGRNKHANNGYISHSFSTILQDVIQRNVICWVGNALFYYLLTTW
jgi:hypothetical protein